MTVLGIWLEVHVVSSDPVRISVRLTEKEQTAYDYYKLDPLKPFLAKVVSRVEEIKRDGLICDGRIYLPQDVANVRVINPFYMSEATG